MEDCVDQVDSAKFMSKLDLKKVSSKWKDDLYLFDVIEGT